MNITNNPNYTCLTSKVNPYLDTITFKPPVSELARKMQATFLFDRIGYVTNAVPYIVSSGNGKPSVIYTQMMSEVTNNPKKYNCTRQELESAYMTTFKVLNAIAVGYKQNKIVNENVFRNGITVLNEKFFEDASNGRLNAVYFIHGMKVMGNDLSKFRSSEHGLE